LIRAGNFRVAGIGIDRLRLMQLGQESVRDGILFPQLKPN